MIWVIGQVNLSHLVLSTFTIPPFCLLQVQGVFLKLSKVFFHLQNCCLIKSQKGFLATNLIDDLQKITDWPNKWKNFFIPDLNKQSQEFTSSRKFSRPTLLITRIKN